GLPGVPGRAYVRSRAEAGSSQERTRGDGRRQAQATAGPAAEGGMRPQPVSPTLPRTVLAPAVIGRLTPGSAVGVPSRRGAGLEPAPVPTPTRLSGGRLCWFPPGFA